MLSLSSATMSNKRCAYLTMSNLDGWSIDADLAFPAMIDRGWTVTPVRWRDDKPNWDEFDAVYIGTPWDYPEEPERFIRLLRSIDASSAILVNDFTLVEWSITKTYLRDLDERGASTVPSCWHDALQFGQLAKDFSSLGAEKIVIKPLVGTNATDTFVVCDSDLGDLEPKLLDVFGQRACIVQPFIDSITDEGEYSLFFFNNEFSHAIQKVPKADDFRVQEEHGAQILSVSPNNELLSTANQVLGLVQPMPVYARVDLVKLNTGAYGLMELELIEPSMYLRMNAEAPERFADAFDQYYCQAMT